MKKIARIAYAIAAVSVIAAALPASAQQAPWYAAIAAGQSRFDLDGTPGDNKDNSINLGVGYKFNPNLAVELGYADFGSFQIGGFNGEAKSTHLSLILSAPFTETLGVYGRLGAASTDRRVSVFGFSDKERKTEALYGIGLQFGFNKNLTGTLEVQELKDSDVRAINVGLRWNF